METATAFPGNTGQRPNNVAPLAEMLRLNGYSTGFFGKNHETAPWEVNRPRCHLWMLGNSRRMGRKLPRDRLVGEPMHCRFDVALPPTPVIGFAAPFMPQSTTRDSEWQVPAMRSCLFVMTRACYRD
jgi:hypothetical protein